MIAGDRGLAGGYNNNVFKLVQQEMEGKELSVLPMGKRAVEHFRSRGVPIFTEAYGEAADVSIGDCFSLSKQLAKAYLACLLYTSPPAGLMFASIWIKRRDGTPKSGSVPPLCPGSRFCT